MCVCVSVTCISRKQAKKMGNSVSDNNIKQVVKLANKGKTQELEEHFISVNKHHAEEFHKLYQSNNNVEDFEWRDPLFGEIMHIKPNLLHFVIANRFGVENCKAQNSVLILLLDWGIDKNCTTVSKNTTPLHMLASFISYNPTSTAAAIKILISHHLRFTPPKQLDEKYIKHQRTPVNLDAICGPVNETALHILCRNYSVRRTLHDKTEQQKDLNKKLDGALHEVVIELLANGCATNPRDSLGRTPLMYACLSFDTPISIVGELLSTQGVDVNAVDSVFGFSALHYCCLVRDAEKVSLLLGHHPRLDWEIKSLDVTEHTIQFFDRINGNPAEAASYNERKVDPIFGNVLAPIFGNQDLVKCCKVTPLEMMQQVDVPCGAPVNKNKRDEIIALLLKKSQNRAASTSN